MLEKVYEFSDSDKKLIERIVDDENMVVNHVILQNGESIPEHFSNSNVCMVIVKGTLTLQLGVQEPRAFSKGKIVTVPYNIQMSLANHSAGPLEFFIFKAPSPRHFAEKAEK